MRSEEPISESLRQLQICNACRYCEGYCAMFGALSRRVALAETDVLHLANLCHDCRACFQACMYAPPHEFGINVPAAMSSVRVEVHERYARPRWLARTRSSRGLFVVAGLFFVAVTVPLWITRGFGRFGVSHAGPGAFYDVIPSWLMTGLGLATGIAAVAAMAAALRSYWGDVHGRAMAGRAPRAWFAALWDAGSLTSLKGGGGGCFYPRATAPSQARRVMHALVFYGFLSAFAATCAAALYQHVLDELPPYGLASVPVVLGTVGGASIVTGVSGILYLKVRSDRRLEDRKARPMDYPFLLSLQLLAVTGILLLVVRRTAAMAVVLDLHLALVAAFFVTAPYGKFAHSVFRFSALVKDRLEELEEEGAPSAQRLRVGGPLDVENR